jgi:hypothetical protein
MQQGGARRNQAQAAGWCQEESGTGGQARPATGLPAGLAPAAAMPPPQVCCSAPGAAHEARVVVRVAGQPQLWGDAGGQHAKLLGGGSGRVWGHARVGGAERQGPGGGGSLVCACWYPHPPNPSARLHLCLADAQRAQAAQRRHHRRLELDGRHGAAPAGGKRGVAVCMRGVDGLGASWEKALGKKTGRDGMQSWSSRHGDEQPRPSL